MDLGDVWGMEVGVRNWRFIETSVVAALEEGEVVASADVSKQEKKERQPQWQEPIELRET